MPELPPWLKVLYPFPGNSFETPEGSINYVDEGTGPAMVLLHGNPTWSFFYRDVILACRDRARCLAPDHLGCGLSEKPQKADYSLAGHIGRTREWIESLEVDSIHLVVHDWGGAIGFGVADALRDRIRCITVLNTAAFPFPAIPLRISACRIPILGTLLVRGANAFVEAATSMTTTEPLSDAVKEGYRFPYGSWGDRVAVDAFVKDIPMRQRHRSRSVLESIGESLSFWNGRPVQIIWGMQDWCFHAGILEEWEKRLPEAKVHRFSEAGHYLLEDAGPQIIPLIRDWNPGRP